MDTHTGETRDERYLRGKFARSGEPAPLEACKECGRMVGFTTGGLCGWCAREAHPERYPDG